MFLLCIGEPMLFPLRRGNGSVLRLTGPQCASSQSDQRQNQETHPGPTRSIPTVANGLRNHLVVFKDTEFAACLPPTPLGPIGIATVKDLLSVAAGEGRELAYCLTLLLSTSQCCLLRCLGSCCEIQAPLL